jgi:large subunit ribosomal protein L22
MEYRAIAKNVKVSPRKVRLVADSIRNLTIPKAVTALVVSRKRGAISLKKTLDSAVSNAVNNSSAKKDDLTIKEINVTEGIMYKRYHFAGRGRTRPYLKRTSHINIVLEDKIVKTMPTVKPIEKNEKEKEKGVVKK